MSLRESFAAWRRWYLSDAEIAARATRADALVDGSSEDATTGVQLASATLTNDPYNPALHRTLARACARRGDVDGYTNHLAVCFQLHELDTARVRADTTLHGVLSKRQLAQASAAAKASVGRDRTRDFCFDEIAPSTRRFTTVLTWPPAHQQHVRATYARFAERSGLTQRHVFPRDKAADLADPYLPHVRDGTMMVEDQSMPGAFCAMGSAVQFFREVAPYVADVRLFFFDQVSPLDELWIVDHAFYMRRHPIDVWDLAAVARYLDDLLLREPIHDPALRRYIALTLTRQAAGVIDALDSDDEDSVALRADAEELMTRAARLDGEQPPYLRARLALLDGRPEQAIAALVHTLEQEPTARAPMLQLAHLYFERACYAEALAAADRLIALGDMADEDVHLLRGQTLDALGRSDEALVAYRRHAKAISSYSGVLLRHADEMLARGKPAAAQLLYKPILRAGYGTGIAAELGLARCADALGNRALARNHYQRVLARIAAIKTAHADSPSIASRIQDCATAASAWLAHEPAADDV